jgi:hypothetical protein
MARSVAVEVDLSEFVNKRPGPACRTGKLMKQLSPEQHEKIVAALAHPGLQTAAVRRKFEEWTGEKVNVSSFQRHCSGECTCER